MSMNEGNTRGAIIFSSGFEEKTIARHFNPNESGTLLEYVLDSVWTVADEIIVVFGNEEPKLSIIESISPFGARVLTTPKGQSAFNTIYTAFRSAKSELCLLTSERVPLLKPNVALALFDNAQGYDLAIPKWRNGKLEPMLAVYRKKAFVRLCSTKGSVSLKNSTADTDFANLFHRRSTVRRKIRSDRDGFERTRSRTGFIRRSEGRKEPSIR